MYGNIYTIINYNVETDFMDCVFCYISSVCWFVCLSGCHQQVLVETSSIFF